MLGKKKSRKDQLVEARNKRHMHGEGEQVKKNRFSVEFFIYLATVLVIALLCFQGQKPPTPVFRPGQVTKLRIIADFPFTYESKIRTDELVEQSRRMVAPVYRIDMAVHDRLDEQLKRIGETLDQLEAEAPASLISPEVRNNQIKALVTQLRAENQVRFDENDLILLLELMSAKQRKAYFDDGLSTVAAILRKGIHPQQDDSLANSATEQALLFGVGIDSQHGRANPLSEEDALRKLNADLRYLGLDTRLERALFRIYKTALQPNLIYDSSKHEAQIEEALTRIKPVQVSVELGQVLIEPGRTITPAQVEQLNAYRAEQRKVETSSGGIGGIFVSNLVLSAGILAAFFLVWKLGYPRFARSRQHILLFAILITLNLGVIRLLQELSETSFLQHNLILLEMLPYASPIAFGAILATILLGLEAGIFVAGLIALFTAMMYGDSFSLLAFCLVGSMVAIFHSHQTNIRARLVRAGAWSGLAAGAFILIEGMLGGGLNGGTEFLLLAQKALVATLVGVFSGVLSIGLLPLFENLFRLTTDITLLELTDYNHPLLRRMQLEAPGTYHHSLMVANLAERAAAEIGANALACRTMALFHDIGKMVKPDYFTENQRDGHNPHIEKNPSMSALVIKSHVKEGVMMANKARLPAMIIDGIKQHHGTGLIWYFFHQAKKAAEKEKGTAPPFFNLDVRDVEESTFRYDGPKPQTRETAVLLLCDSVEAASRSLRKVSATNIEELVDKIFKIHTDDGQLDDAPLTMEDIRRVRKSLNFTLLNTLHQRTEYPEREGEGEKKGNGNGHDHDEAKAETEASESEAKEEEAAETPASEEKQPKAEDTSKKVDPLDKPEKSEIEQGI